MNPEDVKIIVRHRIQQAETAVSDARFLLEGGRSAQSIVNRAYYAMFYAALALIQTTGKVPAKHTGVISLFDTEFVLKGLFSREFSKALHKAFNQRQISDYRAMESISIPQAQDLLAVAEKFVSAVNDYFAVQGQGY